jgi:fluoride exporter
MVTVILVLLVGGAAAVARFLLDAAVQSRRWGEFPLGTLVVNLGGAFLLGLLAGLGASNRVTLVLGTAALGSYTTFSTWMLETHRPAQDGESRLALQNAAVGLGAGLGAVALGRALGGLL